MENKVANNRKNNLETTLPNICAEQYLIHGIVKKAA